MKCKLHILVCPPGEECNQLIGMRGEGGTKAFAKAVKASQLGSHGLMILSTAIRATQLRFSTLVQEQEVKSYHLEDCLTKSVMPL